MPRDAYLESRVLTADPVELIHMLYEYALAQVGSARSALAAGDIPGRSQAIAKTLAALGELEGSLDYNAGGSISRHLARLYQYMRRRLADGNVKREDRALAEVESLMRTLDEGWTAMQHATSAPAALPYSYAVTEPVAHFWSA
jgi:flagellar protein FliS